jgi:hypothetical protein
VADRFHAANSNSSLSIYSDKPAIVHAFFALLGSQVIFRHRAAPDRQKP